MIVNNLQARAVLESYPICNKTIDKFIIESISIFGLKLYAPQPKLFEFRFGEFITADMNYMYYVKTKDVQFLNNLIAVLYRPLKSKINHKNSGDIRAKFKPSNLDYYSRVVAPLNDDIKEMILLNYIGLRDWLSNRYPNIFIEKTANNKGKKTTGWLAIRDKLTDSIHDYDRTDNAFLHDVFRRLNEKQDENEL